MCVYQFTVNMQNEQDKFKRGIMYVVRRLSRIPFELPPPEETSHKILPPAPLVRSLKKSRRPAHNAEPHLTVSFRTKTIVES